MKKLTKIYKENYKHKHTLKYIKSVIESNIDDKFKFQIVDIEKTFALPNGSRLNDDVFFYDKDEKELKSFNGKVMPSYTITLLRENELYTDCKLDDYISFIECLKKAEVEFSKKGLAISPNTIDNKMDFDVIEINNTFELLRDNHDIEVFLSEISYDYESYQSRSYSMENDEKLFYRTGIVSHYNATREHINVENLKHFEKFLLAKCEKDGFRYFNLNDGKFNIYTKRQYRMLIIKELLQ